MEWVTIFLVLFVVLIGTNIVKGIRMGPVQVDASALRGARALVGITPDAPGSGWQALGSRTSADGINLRFDHDDDPQAEAALIVPGGERVGRNSFAKVHTIRLSESFETHHVHNSGYVFRVRCRGDAAVAGKEVRMMMKVGRGRRPYGGQIENDDDTEAAVGGWIEFEFAEVLELSGRPA